MADQLPEDHIEISLTEGEDENRVMDMKGTGPVSNAIVEEYVC